MADNIMSNSLSVYLHIPFCPTRCHYCHFCSSTDLSLRDAYREALIEAIKNAPTENESVDTVYFGGGTPSSLGLSLLPILNAVREKWDVCSDAEITLEANPGTVDLALLKSYREAGFNRISFGLQDSSDNMLAYLGRSHSADDGALAVSLAKEAGFDNISVDFILATPGMAPNRARELARYAVSLDVPHVSSYLLSVEEGTPLFDMKPVLPDDDTTTEIYLAFYDELEKSGYSHYEISNAAREGFQSRHNNGYWEGKDYLGIGPSAASFFKGNRFVFPSDVSAFIKTSDPWSTVVQEGPSGGWDEVLMLRLRLAKGITRELAMSFGKDWDTLAGKASFLTVMGLVTVDDYHIALTDAGFLMSNSVIAFLGDEGGFGL